MSTRPNLRFLKYEVAILAVLAANTLRVLWKPVIGDDSPFLFFFAALALASWFGGMLPGIIATLLGMVSIAFLGLLPLNRTGAVDFPHLLQYCVFVATGVLLSFLMGRLHAALDRSARAERELEQRVRERTEDLVHANRALQLLSSELLTAQETERLRISKELHDDLGQALTLVKLKIGLAANLEEIAQPAKIYFEDASAHVDQAIENMRRLSRDLSPVTVETLGITIALRRLADDFNAAGVVQIAAEIAPIDDFLPLGSAILLYRILQEALNNVVKHSGASTASVLILKTDGGIYVEIKDDGRGMDPPQMGMPGSRGLGLSIMTERVRTLGGSLEIESRAGLGTTLQFTLPVHVSPTEPVFD